MTFVKLGRPFLRSSLLLIVLLLSPQLSYGLQTTSAESVRIQAEDFTDLGNFFTQNFSAEGGEVIRLGFNGDTGTASLDLDSVGVALGENSLDIVVNDEGDGASTLTVLLQRADGSVDTLDSFVLDQNTVSSLVTLTIEDVDVQAGDQLLLDGISNAGEPLRIDAVQFNSQESGGVPTQPSIRINAGGPAHTDAAGNLFIADDFFTGGRTASQGDDVFIVGTGTNASNDSDVDDILYQTERFDVDLSYEIPVENGLYDIRLHFAEIFFNSENERVFDVSIEGLDVLDNYDIFGTRMNAFTPGHDASIVEEFFAVEVVDGFVSLNFESAGADGINNGKVSAIEILSITDATVALLPTGGSTVVAEAGNTDSFAVALTQPPASNVTVQVAPNSELSFSTSTLTFTPTNFDVPQTIVITAIDDTDEEGQQNVPVPLTSSSSDPAYDGITRTLNVTVLDDDLVPVQFDVRTLTSDVENPTSGAFGPDGRLYVCDQSGRISAFTFDGDYNVTDTQVINTIPNLPDPGFTLGITFNPFEEVGPGDTPTLYVSQSYLFRATEEYENNVLALSGPNHSVVTEVITGLPVSGFDHGINGMQFDGEGNLLIAVGGNTNTGLFDGVFGSDAPESPLTSAVLRARISDPDFNGDVEYEFVNILDPDLISLASDLGISLDPNNQLLGNFVQVRDVPGEVEVETYAAGLRNSYDIVFSTLGHVFATDNGPNGIAQDELNFVPEGAFLGHPSIPRGMVDPRQVIENAEYDAEEPSTDDYTAPLTDLPSSTNGIDEYRAETFGGQLRGQLIAQRFNNQVFFFELDGAGTGPVNTNSFGGGQIADGLDILTGPGGVIFGIDRNQDRITIAEPVDNNVTIPTAYDIFPFRAPAVGGNQFVIGGTNFGNMNNTTVLIDGVQAELTSVEDNRIVGIVPALAASTVLRDVTVTSNQVTSILESSFLPLGEGAAVLKGDVDMNGVVNFLDIPAFIAVLQGGIFQAEADCDCSLVVDFADIPAFIAILSGQ